MALTSELSQNTSPVTLTEDGQTIAVEFQFLEHSDVKVFSGDDELTLGSHYDVSGGEGSTGTITFKTLEDGGPAVGSTINVLRYITATQPVSMPNSFYYKLLEGMADRYAMLAQQIVREQAALSTALQTGDFSSIHLGIPIIPDASITTEKIVDAAVTAAKIQSVPWSKVTGAPEIGGIEVVGDGETDNTSVLQAAIDAAYAAGGGVIPLPAGTFLVSGITLKDNVYLRGASKRSSIIKLADGSDEHVISAGAFDTYATGTSIDSPLGCRSGGLISLTIDGNKSNQSVAHHGLAYFGVDMFVSDVQIRDCLGVGLYCESPGAAHSTETQNLQHSIDTLECDFNDAGNLVYNGQSDSTIKDIECYTTGATAANVTIGSKSSGLRIIGLHAFGTSQKGVVLNASAVSMTNCAVESATATKLEINANSCQFQGDIYEVSTSFDSKAIKIASGVIGTQIRARVSNVKYAVEFVSDGGNGLYDIMHYSNEATAVLFSGTPSANNWMRCLRFGGGVSRTFSQFPKQMLADSDAAILKFLSNGHSVGFYSDDAGSLRQFNIEHTAGATSYLSATGGTTKARLIARSSATDADIEIEPKGAGTMIVGSFKANALTGQVAMFATSTVPYGWLECDGTVKSRTTYAALFAVVGTTFGVGDGSSTFNLPDLRGEFIRGWDHGRGIDTDRAIGTAQTDAFQGHEHELLQIGNSGGTTGLSRTGTEANASSDLMGAAVTDGSHGTPRVASETRPRNVALMACIKY